jgi:single-strand DNA-binding protein
MATGAAAEQAAQRGTKKRDNADDDRGPGSVAGNLTDDPELRFTSSGRPVANLRVAYSERVLNKETGQWEDSDAAFYDLTCWGQLAENVAEHLQRGDRVVCEGRWTSTTWTDRDGQDHEKIVLTARDLGPSMLFRGARVERPDRSRASGAGRGGTRQGPSAAGDGRGDG